jgi:hypothetical protein
MSYNNSEYDSKNISEENRFPEMNDSKNYDYDNYNEIKGMDIHNKLFSEKDKYSNNNIKGGKKRRTRRNKRMSTKRRKTYKKRSQRKYYRK